MTFVSSGSAVAGFPCSKPPLNPIKKASSIKWRLFYIEKSFLNQQILGIGHYCFNRNFEQRHMLVRLRRKEDIPN